MLQMEKRTKQVRVWLHQSVLQMEKRTKQVRVWLHQSGVATNNKNNLFSNRRRKQSGANACSGAWLRRGKHGLTEGGSGRCPGGVRAVSGCVRVVVVMVVMQQTNRTWLAAPPPNNPTFDSSPGLAWKTKKKGRLRRGVGAERGWWWLPTYVVVVVESDDPKRLKPGGRVYKTHIINSKSKRYWYGFWLSKHDECNLQPHYFCWQRQNDNPWWGFCAWQTKC